MINLESPEPKLPRNCFFCEQPPLYRLNINFQRHGIIIGSRLVFVCSAHHITSPSDARLSERPTSQRRGSVVLTLSGRDVIVGSINHSNTLLVERADVEDLIAALQQAYGLDETTS